MKGFLWPRSTPSQVFSADFDSTRQQQLIEHTFACCGGPPIEFTALTNYSAIAEVSDVHVAIAIGDGADAAMKFLAQTAADRLARGVSTRHLHTLVLVLPGLDEKYFCIKGKPYKEAALALEAVSRVVVFVNGRDATISTSEGQPALGRVGPAKGSDPRVGAIDISPVIEHHNDSAYGVLCSCEALGLMRRILLGSTLASALPGRARILGAEA